MNIESLSDIAATIIITPWMLKDEAVALGERHGLEFIAAGIDRYVYRAGGKVYKFASYIDSSQQRQEIENYRCMMTFMENNPERCAGWGLPFMEAVDADGFLVIVAEDVGDEVDDWAMENPWNANDAHSDNARIYNGIRYLIDLGLADRHSDFCW